ncbi:MAG: leucine-rich repeat domain-containing protein, partial [Gallicola sp.]|nr:leucine-rich repeat domain-containing protein [Gallicola sp.]
ANVTSSSYTVPSTVRRIASYSFIYSDLLKAIELPNGLEVIEEGAFAHCKNLISIDIPASVNEIGSNFLRGTLALKSVKVDENNTHYASKEGVLFNKNMEKLIYHPTNADEISYTFPESVTEVENYAFRGSKKLETIVPSRLLKKIGRGSFDDCDMLDNIEFFDALESIASSAFSGSDTLTHITFGRAVKTVDKYAFHPCRNLKKISMKTENPPSAASDAFYGVVSCTLEVPIGCKEAYQNAPEWSSFQNIVEVDYSGIGDLSINDNINISYHNYVLVFSSDKESSFELYNLSGQRLLNKRIIGSISIYVEPGAYIIKTGKKTKKIILR